MYRLFFTIMLPVLAVMTANPAMSSSDPPPPSRLDCSGAFSESSAASSCSMDKVAVSNGMCSFDVRCRSAQSTTFDVSSNGFIVNETDAGRLVNCDGRLKVGSC